ncbi:SPARC-like protein 1, partial [Clarias magur]
MDLLCLFLLASALTKSVQSTTHEKHKSLYRWPQNTEEKDDELPMLEEVHDSILPTFFPFEASSPEPEDGDISKDMSSRGDGTDEAYPIVLDMSDEDGKNIPVLLSEEMITQLLKASEEEQHDAQGEEDEDINEGSVEIPKHDGDEQQKQQKENDLEEEEVGSSTDSEIPVDLDFASQDISMKTQSTKQDKSKPLTSRLKAEEKVDSDLPIVMEYYDDQPNQDYEDPKDVRQEKAFDQVRSFKGLQQEQILPNPDTDRMITDADKFRMDLGEKNLSEEKEGGRDTNENVSQGNGKQKEQMKSKRLRQAQSDQALSAEVTADDSQIQELEKRAELTLNMAQRKKGKLASILGMNPVQIRATVDLFPRITPTALSKSRTGTDPEQEASVDSCENFHCKRGKTCKLNDKKKASCVCQEAADCPPSLNELEHVQKIYENERRLHAGDHPIELLARDFEKNYNMYIYPVHWQFAQMDQHPSDRFLSHSELAPLRVPLVPMEHCTSVFFHECDADKDKLLSFREWCHCFGIKDEEPKRTPSLRLSSIITTNAENTHSFRTHSLQHPMFTLLSNRVFGLEFIRHKKEQNDCKATEK